MYFELPKNVTWKALNSCFVLLDLKTSYYYTLNETASFIWQCMMDRKSSAQILQSMEVVYDCDKNRLREDLDQQIKYLTEEGLISTFSDKSQGRHILNTAEGDQNEEQN